MGLNKPDGTPKKLLNINKIKNLGWEPKIKLNEGIRETIKLLNNEDNLDKFLFLISKIQNYLLFIFQENFDKILNKFC